MEIKTTEELRVLSEEASLDVWKHIADKKWVAVVDIKKRLFNSDIPIRYSQQIIEELSETKKASQSKSVKER